MIDGVMVNKSTKTSDYKLAARIAAQFETEAIKTIVQDGTRPLTLGALVKKYLKGKEGLPSHRNIALNLGRFDALNSRHLKDIEKDEVQDIVNACRDRGMQESTLALMVRYWNSLQNYAIKNKITPAAKIDNIRNFKGKTRYLSEEEEEKLLAALQVPEKQRGMSPTMRVEKQNNLDLVITLLELGCRFHEAANLTWSQVDFTANGVHIKRGKGGVDSTHFMAPRLREVFDRRYAERTDDDHVFPSKVGRYKESAWMLRMTKKAGLSTAGGQITLHSLRHTFANRMRKDNMTIREVQQLLGHKSLMTTELYDHTNPTETARKAFEAQKARAARQQQ